MALKLVSEGYLSGETPHTPTPPSGTPTLASNARFQREARAASALNHPNICTIHDIGEQDGRPYLVMELLQGQTLKQYLVSHRPLPPAELLSFARQAASALAAAHSRGIIHRDIKPANIFVVQPPGGQPHIKILDFGLAKRQADPMVAGAAAAGSKSTQAASNGDLTATSGGSNDLTLTNAGSTLGTIAYMSPEQAKGQALDARSDLFSLGCVLYEAATGASPFAGASPAETFAALLMKDAPAASSVNPTLPKGFDPILARLLAKDKADRYQSAGELLSDLDGLAESRSASDSGSHRATPLSTLEAPPPSRSSKLLIFAAAAAIILIAGGLWFWRGHHTGSATSPASNAPVISEKDSIILADFVNNTGNPVFDTTLKQALAIQLEQSPTLNIVSQQHLRQSMKYL